MFMEVEKAPGTKKNVMVRDLDLSDVPALLEIANHKDVITSYSIHYTKLYE